MEVNAWEMTGEEAGARSSLQRIAGAVACSALGPGRLFDFTMQHADVD